MFKYISALLVFLVVVKYLELYTHGKFVKVADVISTEFPSQHSEFGMALRLCAHSVYLNEPAIIMFVYDSTYTMNKINSAISGKISELGFDNVQSTSFSGSTNQLNSSFEYDYITTIQSIQTASKFCFVNNIQNLNFVELIHLDNTLKNLRNKILFLTVYIQDSSRWSSFEFNNRLKFFFTSKLFVDTSTLFTDKLDNFRKAIDNLTKFAVQIFPEPEPRQ